MAAIFMIAGCLSACDDSTPLSLRTDTRPVFQTLGKQYFSIPTNYLLSRDVGGVLVVATWPEIEGRSRDNYEHYLASNISISVGPGNTRSLQSVYRVYVEQAWGFKGLTPVANGHLHGFDAYILRHPKNDPSDPLPTQFDVYVKRSPDGEFTSIIRCDGKTTKDIINPQCQFWTTYPDFPNLLFKIGFSRNTLLEQVNEVESASRNLFLRFNAAVQSAFDGDAKAKEALLKSASFVDGSSAR